MSVKEPFRNTSDADFVVVARRLRFDLLDLYKCIGKKYREIFSPDFFSFLVNLTSDTFAANKIYVKEDLESSVLEQNITDRKSLLKSASINLNKIDSEYNVLMEFISEKYPDIFEKKENLIQNIGANISKEHKLIKGNLNFLENIKKKED